MRALLVPIVLIDPEWGHLSSDLLVTNVAG